MFEEKLKQFRKKYNFTQEQLSKILKVERSTIAKWESGAAMPQSDKLKTLADIFGVTIDYLIRGGDEKVKVPILGRVQAGKPTQAVENIIGYEDISAELALNGEYFALEIKGDSMSPDMREGDIVIVRAQSDVASGDIAVVLAGSEEATVKKITKHNDGITLVAFNKSYKPVFYSTGHILSLPVGIIGRVVELRRKF